MKKIIAIHANSAERAAKEWADTKGLVGFRFPLRGFLDLVGEDADILETLYTVVQRCPEENSVEAEAAVSDQVRCRRHYLEMAGAKTIVCPDKRMPGGGFRQSECELLMVKALSICLRLKPDFLVLVSGADDLAPMVGELRDNGIRTEVFAASDMLGSRLKRVSYRVVDLREVLEKIHEAEIELEGVCA